MGAERRLFRQQAIDFQHDQRQWGDVASLQPLSLKVMVWFLVAVVAALMTFLAFAQYARKETAVGYLTPTRGTAKIFVPRRGTIREVHVEEGASVQEGEPLLTVDTDMIAADGSDVNAAVFDTLSAQKHQILQTIRDEERRVVAERERLSALAKGLEAEIAQIQAQLALQKERLAMVDQEVAAAATLRDKGFMTLTEFRRRQLAQNEGRQGISALHQQMAAKQNQLTESRSSLSQLPTLMAQKAQALRNEVATVEQRIAEIKARGAYVIRAPVSGRVTTLQANVGQSADPQRLQLELIPADAVLQAELLVPARAIGFVEPGQPVRILYEAFPYQHFGTYQGRIVRVSQTLLTGTDAGGPLALKEPAYRVVAALDRQQIDANGKPVTLQPDMLLRADIILERRSLASWLTNPIRSVRM